MSCQCIEKAVYVLGYAEVPTSIFSRIVCPTHSAESTASSPQSVTCFLCPDVAISGCEKVDQWPVVYHATSADVIRSILEHGQLLQAGDTLHDGTVIRKRKANAAKSPAVWTYPGKEDAKKAAAAITADARKAAAADTGDEGATKFVMLLRLRQKPGTFTVNRGGGIGGSVIWSTNRRGTLFMEALEVFVFMTNCSSKVPPLMTEPPLTYATSFTCPLQKLTFHVLRLLNIPPNVFDSSHNKCYCSACDRGHWRESKEIAGESYVIPHGWTRFGLAVNPVFAEVNGIWHSWPTAFHGCHPRFVFSIIRNRTLLIPGDVVHNGTIVGTRNTGETRYFMSPTIGYAAHPWYAKPVPFVDDADGKRKYFQTVLMLKVRPGSYRKQGETEGGEIKLHRDYSIISEDEVEWFSSRRGCTHPYGVLIRVIDASNLDQLNDFFELPKQHRLTVEQTLEAPSRCLLS